VTQGILCKGRRSLTETVANQILVDDFVETTDALLTNLFQVVEAGLQLASALLLTHLAQVTPLVTQSGAGRTDSSEIQP
jgi:hypothetical protein